MSGSRRACAREPHESAENETASPWLAAPVGTAGFEFNGSHAEPLSYRHLRARNDRIGTLQRVTHIESNQSPNPSVLESNILEIDSFGVFWLVKSYRVDLSRNRISIQETFGWRFQQLTQLPRI